MKIKCDKCGKEFDRRPSDMKKVNYCSKKCRHEALTIKVKCECCGKEFERLKCATFAHVFCSRACAKGYLVHNFSETAKRINPTRMTLEVRTKLRKVRLGKGNGKTYTKIFGKHEHRIIAEQMLGRPLKQGEIVHHIDGNKRNNHPLNLMVLPSQSAHALWHKNEELDPSKNYE